MKTIIPILTLILAMSAGAQPGNSFKELYNIMDKSQLQYEIMSLKRPVVDTVQPVPVSLDIRVVESAAGNAVQPFTRTPEADSVMAALEEAYRNKQNDQVRTLCQQLLAADQADPKAQAYLAETYYKDGDYTAAVAQCKGAIETGHYNWLAHLILGKCYQQQAVADSDMRDQALRELALALVLNRDVSDIEYALSSACKEFGLDYGHWKFLPQYALSKYKHTVYVQTRREWLPYAVTKAVWSYEPGYREKMGGGETAGSPTTTEEREALLNLAAQQMDKQEEVADQSIKALMQAVDAKLLDEYIIFEAWLPGQPGLAYGLPRETLARLADYVLRVRAGWTGK